MKINDVIVALTALNDPDAEVVIGGVDHLVIEKISAGWNGHVPATMTHRYEINSPPLADAVALGMTKLRQQGGGDEPYLTIHDVGVSDARHDEGDDR